MDKANIYLLDTNILLALVRGSALGNYIRQIYRLDDVLRRPLISIVTHGELMAMADHRGWGEPKRKSLVAALQSMVTIDLNDPEILQGYVLVSRASRNAPGGARVLSDNDKWIAASTRAAGAILLTTDRDFLHLDRGVCAVVYVDPKSGRPEPKENQL